MPFLTQKATNITPATKASHGPNDSEMPRAFGVQIEIRLLVKGICLRMSNNRPEGRGWSAAQGSQTVQKLQNVRCLCCVDLHTDSPD